MLNQTSKKYFLPLWILILLLGFLIQIFVAYQIFQPSTPFSKTSLLLLQIVSSLIWTFAIVGIRSPQGFYEFSLTFVLHFGLSLPLPIFGPFASAFVFYTTSILKGEPQPEIPYVFGDGSQDLSAELNHQAFSMNALLAQANTSARRQAAYSLQTLQPQVTVPFFKRVIRDSDEQVRLYAQSMLAKVTDTLEVTLNKLKAELQKQGPNPQKLLRLAEQYHEFVYLGLHSKHLQAIYLQNAIELLQQAHQLDPQNLRILFLLMKYYLHKGDLENAQKLLHMLEQRNFTETLLLPWQAEIYYDLHDWNNLTKTLAKLKPSNRLAVLNPVIDFWHNPNHNYA